MNSFPVQILKQTLLVCAILLSACSSVPHERDEALTLYAQGRYEDALGRLDAGLLRAPDNPYLQGARLRMQVETISRLLLRANELIALGKLDEAEKEINRAWQIDPKNERAKAALLDIARERRQLAALEYARAAIAKGQTSRAQAIVEAALKDNPRHAGLISMRRDLELQQRQSQDIEGTRITDMRPITLEFRDTPVRTVLDVVSRNSGVSFILDKDVKQDLRTTVFLKQARVEDALELIASTNQLTLKVLNPRTVLIYPATADKIKEYQDLVVKVFFLANADAKQLANILKSTLKLRETQVDERLNTILIRESPETVRLAERLVALHDVADAEVVLDVSVMEVSTSRLTELGIKPPDGFSLSALPLSGSSQLTVSSLRTLNADRIGVGLGSLDVKAHGETGDVNVLANPKIRAKNREKAKILIGDKIPIITSSTNPSSNFVSETVQYQDVGLKLEVEPNITLDDEVSMKVGLEVSSLGKEVRTTNSVAYQIGTRMANTVLKLKDGETQLLAGLISKDDRASTVGVPGLGEIPVLGRLFAQHSNNGQQTEIVLAITPRIVRNIRRPDVNQTEFWSGSESRMRLRPLALPEEPTRAPGAGSEPVPDTGAAATLNGASDSAHDAATPGASITMNVPKAATVGAQIAIPIRLSSSASLKGVSLNLTLDPALFEFVSAEAGSVLRADNAPVNVIARQDKEGKKLVVGLLRSANQGAPATAGEVVTITLKALAKGSASIGLISGHVVPEAGALQPLTPPAPGKIEIQ